MITKEFVTAGRAIFTIQNAEQHFTYKVTRSKPNANFRNPAFFVSVMTGTDNEEHYTYIGLLNPDTGDLRMTAGSKLPESDNRVTIARYALQVAYGRRGLKEGHQLRHSGKCGRCGRTLTNPESLDNGIGPECIKFVRPSNRQANLPIEPRQDQDQLASAV